MLIGEWRAVNITVVEGEAMTILEAMLEAISRGWSNIVLKATPKWW
jgi:hypothetical protein